MTAKKLFNRSCEIVKANKSRPLVNKLHLVCPVCEKLLESQFKADTCYFILQDSGELMCTNCGIRFNIQINVKVLPSKPKKRI
jgi:transcription elongation factor Elf1